MSGQITVLLNSGMDAFTNLWDVQFTFPTNAVVGSFDNFMSVRASGFNPPELSAMTAPVDYKAVQLTRLLPKLQGDRTFTIEFRMDSNYDLYQKLLNWKHIWVNPSGEVDIQAGALGDNLAPGGIDVTSDPANYGKVIVVAYTSETSISGYSDSSATVSVGAEWDFYDVICTKVGSPNYQRAGADAVTVSAEFIFGRYSEPGESPTTQPSVLYK